MKILIKTLKIQLIGIVIFGLSTILIALLLTLTPLREEWTLAGLVFALAAACYIVGVLEGKIICKRGLIVGFMSAAILISLVFISLNIYFDGDFKLGNNDVFLCIPLFVGCIGGVAGTNSNKSS